MKKSRLAIGLIYALILVAVLIIIFILKSNQFSAHLVMNNDGHLISSNDIEKNLLNSDMKLEDAEYNSSTFFASEIIYEKAGKYYLGDAKTSVSEKYPLFVNDDTALLCLEESATLISDHFDSAKCYSGLYINNGLSFNPDMERAYREEFILMSLTNGLYINTKPIVVNGSLFVEVELPVNSIIRFMENEIRYYQTNNGLFTPARIAPVSSSTDIKIEGISYPYYDFLEKLGIYEKGELLESEAEKKEEEEKVSSQIEPLQPVSKPQEYSVVSEVIIRQEEQRLQKKEREEIITMPPEPIEEEEEKITLPPEDTQRENVNQEEREKDPSQYKPQKQEVKEPDPAIPAGLPEEVKSVGINPAVPIEIVEEPPATPEEKPGNPEWKMPSVKLGDFSTSVYSIMNKGMEIDNSEFLHRSGVSFSIYQKDKLVMKKSFLSSNDAVVGPLMPNTEYNVVVVMDYYDKYGVRQTEEVKKATVQTRPLTELKPLQMNWTNGDVFYDKIQLKYLSITNAIEKKIETVDENNKTVTKNIYIETVQYISRVEVNLSAKDNASMKYGMLIGAKDLENLRTGVQVLYESMGRIASDTQYYYEFVFYDRFGNILPTQGIERGEIHTCKRPPSANITLIKNEVQDIKLGIIVDNPNATIIREGSTFFSVFDKDDNPVSTSISRKDKDGNYVVQQESGLSHAISQEMNTIEFLDLLDYEVYKIRVYCDYDINDDKGMYVNSTIGEMSFTTMPISSLGYTFFDIAVQEIKDNSATFLISLDTVRTDSRLVNMLSDLDISFTRADTGNGTGINTIYYKEGESAPVPTEEETVNDGLITMTPQEISMLKVRDEVTGKTPYYVFKVENLSSITQYNIKIKPRVKLGTAVNQVYRELLTFYSPSTFTTLKKSPVISIDRIYASESYIKLHGIAVDDPDGAIISYPITVTVYDEAEKSIASFQLPSAEKVSIINLDKLLKNHEYTFVFKAKAFNNGYDMTTKRSNFELYTAQNFEKQERLTIATREAVSGSINLLGLDGIRMNQTIEIPAIDIRSHNTRVTLYQNYRFTHGNQIKAKFSMDVNFGEEQFNSFQINYSYVNRSTNYAFYLVDPDTNSGAQPFASYLVENLTRGQDSSRWTDVKILDNGFTLSGTQKIYVVATTYNNSGSINCLWGIRFHKAETSATNQYYANLNALVNDPRDELMPNPAYKLKIFKDGVWVDTRRHEWSVNPDGSYTLMMYQVAPDGSLTLKDWKTYAGQEKVCDTDFYYAVDKGHHTYRFEMWATVYDYEIEVGKEEFTTEEEIYAIRTANDLADVRYGINRKYYVLNDITFPLGWNNIVASQTFSGELDFRGHTLSYNSMYALIPTIGYYGSLKNLVFTYVNGWGSDVERQAERIVTNNYGDISNIYAIRNNGNVAQTNKNDVSGICHTNHESGIVENFVVELKDAMYATNYAGGVAVYNKGIIRNGYIYGQPLQRTPQANLTEDQFSSNNYMGGIVGINRQTGIVENVYSLIDIKTRPVKSVNDYVFELVGINDGTIRNSFSIGDVYYGGEIRQDFGPAYRNRYAGSNTKNTFYYSEKDYGKTNNTRIAKLLLHDTSWYNRIFNLSGSTTKGQMNLSSIDMGYYPHVVWPEVMPTQANIPLPTVKNDNLKIIDTTIIEQGESFAKAVITFENPDKLEIMEINVRWLQSEIISQEEDGKFYRVTIRLTQPELTKYYSSYDITGFIYSLGFKGLTESKNYEMGTEPKLAATFFKPITTTTQWYSIKDDYAQNYRLEADLDFDTLDPKIVTIPANMTLSTGDARFKNDAFSGVMDGNGHRIRYVNTGDFGYIFGKLTGTIKNLTVENLNTSQGNCQFKGLVGRMLEGSLIDNVHILGFESVSYEHCGAIAGDVYAGAIVNSSAHDVVIKTVADGNYAQYVGGLVGKHRQSGSNTIYANVSIENCYVDGLDITVRSAGDCGGAGGLAGFIRASGEIKNVYVVNGKIDTAYKNVGGLIGAIDTFTNYESSKYTLKDYYVDVDITSITERCGGVIGYCQVENAEAEEEHGLVLGNTISSLPVTTEVGRFYGKNTFADKKIYGYEKSIVNGSLSTDPALLTYADLCNSATYGVEGNLYWDTYFLRDDAELAQGILPKLSYIMDSTKALPYQRDYHLENEPIKIKSISSKNYSTGEIFVVEIITEHAPELTITSADFSGLKVAGLADPSKAVIIEKIPTGTILQYTMEIEGYYDAYYLKKLHYNLGAEALTQNTYLNTGIVQQFLKISSADQWNTLMAKENFGLKSYNVQITGDLDFGIYSGNAAAGVLVNHLSGEIKSDGSYYTIKGINMESTISLVCAAYGNVTSLNFSDITLKKKKDEENPTSINAFGIFEAVTGSIKNCNFTDIRIEALNSAYVGISALSYGMNVANKLTGITVYGTYTVVPSRRAVGGFIGRLSGAGGIDDLEATYLVVQGRDYTGGILGIQDDGRYLWNIRTNHSVVYSTNASFSYVGGIIGSANVTSLSDVCGNLSSKDGVVLGTSYVGGVLGLGSATGNRTMNNDTWDNYKTLAQQVFVGGAGSYIGGITGQGRVHRGEVRNATVYGISYIGGATGNGAIGFTYVTDSVIGSVYDRNVGDTGNLVFRTNVANKITAVQKVSSSTEDIRLKAVCTEAEKVLAYLTTPSRNSSWGAASFTGSNNTCIGGISGRTIAAANSMVVNSRIGSFGAISVGGIVPLTQLDSYNSDTYRIIACGTQNCEIYGAQDVGGIVGTHYRAYIESCYSNSNVTATRSTAGGIAGRVKATNLYSTSETPYFSHMYYIGTVTAPDYVGGIVGKMEQDLYNVNQGLLMAGNVVVTDAAGNVNLFVNKQAKDARSLTDCIIYENSSITLGTATQSASAYYQANDDLLLLDEISFATTTDLKSKSTYTTLLGWSSDVGISSSNYTSRYFDYSGLVNNYMPYLRSVPFNNYIWTNAIRILPFQEGYQPDGTAENRSQVDVEGLYVYKYESFDGGVPIPGSGAQVVMKRMLLRAVSNTLPRAEFYAVDADLLNIEFTEINPEAVFKVMANGVEVAKHAIDRRTFTLHYDYKTELEVIVTKDAEEHGYSLLPEEVSRNVMTWGAEYYYTKADGIEGSKKQIPGQFVNLYAGHAIDVSGRVVDLETESTLRSFDRIRIEEETVPLQQFTYDGYKIQTFKRYSLVNGVKRENMRLYIKEGQLSVMSAALSMVMDSIILDHYNGAEYCSILAADGTIVDMTDTILKLPEEFDNSDIQYMTNNLNSTNHVLLVRYYDGAVAGFNYITGELLPIDSPRGTTTELVDLTAINNKSANASMTNFATLYVDAMEFETNLTDIGWAEVSGANLVGGTAVSEASTGITNDPSAVPVYVESTYQLDDGSIVMNNVEKVTGITTNGGGTTNAGTSSGSTVPSNSLTGISPEGIVLSGFDMENLDSVFNGEYIDPMVITELAVIQNAIEAIKKNGSSKLKTAQIEALIEGLKQKEVPQLEIDRLKESLQAALEHGKENSVQPNQDADKNAHNTSEEQLQSEAETEKELSSQAKAGTKKPEEQKTEKKPEKEKQKYIAVYDTVKEQYVLYEEQEILENPKEELESVNEKVKRSGHMIDYRAKTKADVKNSRDENIYGYSLLALSIIGITMLLSTLVVKNKRRL